MAQSHSHKVAIVGGGVSGLTAIKACLEEGLEPYCFESNSDVGGIWLNSDQHNFDDERLCVYDSLITNTSKSIMAFSDFQFPAEYPQYLPHSLYWKYLINYVEHFNLRRHIYFNTKVMAVRKADDHNCTGQWSVSTVCTDGKQLSHSSHSTHIFHGVMICKGLYHSAYVPPVSGLDLFQGRVSHTMSYRKPYAYKDRTVIVVGAASSAVDVACDLAPVAKTVYLSVNEGTYVISRLHNGSTPTDVLLSRFLSGVLPPSLAIRLKAYISTRSINPRTSGLGPKPYIPWKRRAFVINDILPCKVVGALEECYAQDVICEDGLCLRGIDDILFATGYLPKMSDIIDPDEVNISMKENAQWNLYMMTFPLNLDHDTLSIHGMMRINGPVAPVVELQARLAARVFANLHQLPSDNRRKVAVDVVNRKQMSVYGRYMYKFQYLDIADSLAEELQVKPSWWTFLASGDIRLACAVFFGTVFPSHYRLCGPNAWPGARDSILMPNVTFPSVFRVLPEESRRSEVFCWWICITTIILSVLLLPAISISLYHLCPLLDSRT